MATTEPTQPRASSPTIAIVDENGKAVQTIETGDAMVLRGEGLQPASQYAVTLADDRDIATLTLTSDRHGLIRDTVVWPQVGIDDPRAIEQEPVDKAAGRWRDRAIKITLRDARKTVAVETKIRVTSGARPLAVATDGNGRLLNGFEIGKYDATLSLLGFEK